MDWTMIGALGEILGAAAVVGTLGYLARQVRQSNVAVRHEADREALDLFNRYLGTIAQSPQVAGVFRRGLEDDPGLTADERMQLRAIFMQMTFALQRSFMFEEELGLGLQNAGRVEIVGTPGYRRWFAQRKHWFSPAFREQVEKDIAAGSGYTVEWLPARAEHASDMGESATSG